MIKIQDKNKKEEEGFKPGELRRYVLAAVGMGILIGGIMITPNFPIVLGSILSLIKEFTKKDIQEKKIKRVLKTLEKNKIIFIEQRNNEIYVHLKGFTSPILKYSLKPLLALKQKEKKWNKKWFLVIFDVPEEQRNKRDYLRNFLRDIGFYQYQQSAYVFPYECEKEIALIKRIVEGGKYINYIIADKIENENQIKTYFKI